MTRLNLSVAAKIALMAMVITSTPAAAEVNFIGSRAASGCTPASVNPGAVSRIRPHTSIEMVIAMLGCNPTEIFFAEKVGVTKYSFLVPILNVELDVFSDSMGVSFALYSDRTNPLETSYSSGFRAEQPLTPNWMPSAGVIPTVP